MSLILKTLLSYDVIQQGVGGGLPKSEKNGSIVFFGNCDVHFASMELWFIFAMIIINVIGVLGSSVENDGEYPSDPGGKVTPLCKRLGLR